jgi:hypothetical protein
MTPITGEFDTGSVDVSGTQHSDVVRLDACGESSVQFNLGGNYSRFTAQIGLSDTIANPGQEWRFTVQTINGDGNQETRYNGLISYGEADDVDVPLEGILRMTISVGVPPDDYNACEYDSPAVWIGPTLHEAGR